MQSKNKVVVLGISIFEKLKRTVKSNCSADRVRNALGMSIDLVEVSIFYMSEKTSGQTIWPKKSAFLSYLMGA